MQNGLLFFFLLFLPSFSLHPYNLYICLFPPAKEVGYVVKMITRAEQPPSNGFVHEAKPYVTASTRVRENGWDSPQYECKTLVIHTWLKCARVGFLIVGANKHIFTPGKASQLCDSDRTC